MRIISRLAIAFVTLAAGLAIGAPPATAVDCVSNFPWASEVELQNYVGSPTYGCGRNYVTTPPIGERLDPNSTAAPNGLLTPPRVAFYASHGFTPNFLWYASRTTTTVGPSDARQWTACNVGLGTNGICPDLKIGPMAPDFDGTFQLHIVGDDTTFIALACGNYTSYDPTTFRPPAYDNPVPYIHGVKFRDDDRDGVRDAGEQLLSGWQVRITRVSSLIDQPGGSWTVTTDASGRYQFDLDGHGPGTYVVEEIVQNNWKNYTPNPRLVNVEFGVGDRPYQVDFGNAETVVDVAKTAMLVLGAPDHLDANVPTDVTVRVTVANLGPADQVLVRDELVAVLPEDCSTPDLRRTFTELLRRDQPVTRDFTFTITCRAPSEHEFEFDDVLSITSPDIVDMNPNNNEASTSFIAPVHAYTDLAATATLMCAERTDVDVAADCDVEVTVTNDGFGDTEIPVDATLAAQLALPDDCTAQPELATIRFPGLVDGDSVAATQRFSVVCTHRSFHEIEASVALTADDPHVFDTDVSNNEAGDGPSIMEVFHDATMAATDVHLVCDETLGGGPFPCTATIDYVKSGPAPLVHVDLNALLEGPAECEITDPTQVQTFVLDDLPGTRQFTWTIECEPGDTLHPFKVTTDITPSDNEPHAVDAPGPIMDWWVVPYCLPTVNPHGQQEPQAPGSGMNEDGFYVFGTLPSQLGEGVLIRDDASGYEFGPFTDGTRIKWVEANGADPSITAMGGGNGNGNGQALAVDYQIRAQGDAQAFFVDERGVEVTVTCLVPPFPK